MIRTTRPYLLLLALLAFLLPPAHAQLTEFGDGGPGPVKAPHLTVELVSLAPSLAPGASTQVALVITLDEKWHVYWQNPGYAGEPPHVRWTLPDGLTAGPMQFPAPSRLPLGPFMDFGYEDSVALPFQITAAPSLSAGPAHLDAHVTWLVCRETCFPGKAHLGIDLNIAAGAPPGPMAGPIAQALKNIPRPLPANMKVIVLGGKSDFVLTFTKGQPQPDAEFYPFDPDQIQNAAEQDLEGTPDGVRIRLKRAEDSDHPGTAVKLPATLHGVLKLSDTEAYDITAPVVPGELAAAPPAPRAPGGKLTFLSAIGLAFVGGIILNLMPCVFPVLFLKGLALVNSHGQERRHMRAHGLVYTLGILVSFWIIVGVLLILRAGGSQAGWGFQLQSPAFVALLASFLFFFALSLAGQFDLGLSLTSAGGSLAEKKGYTGSFFTGILATVVATPCTAPLMGAAIGFALAQPVWVTFGVFTALGLGLAVPYLLLTLQPAWTRILPRPGAWMEVLKQLTAVPLFGTVIWLAWVFGSLYSSGAGAQGPDHMARLLWCFLVLAIAGWTLAKWPAQWKSAIAATLLVVAGLSIPLTAPKVSALKWQPYTQAALDQARAEGHPVFIDFTAAWCLSCQVNEKVVLQSAEVQSQLTSHHFVVLRADWTQYDPEITRQLQSIGRSGVPTYVIYPAKGTADVLPELLTKSIVLTAIDKDAK